MEFTEKYHLSQWEKQDRIMMEDFNGDNQKIEAVLARHDGELKKLGNCRVETFSYVGSGVKGNGQKRRIAFDARPVWMVIIGGGNILWANGVTETHLFLGKYVGVNYELTLTNTDLTWEGNTAVLSSSDPATRMDASGTYGVIVLFAEDQ
ncbi:MAG: hypothetical protein HFF61_12980 [Oscillospiraceae bacterium]|nr:hypothetical protein [Oscillospiraceae bacterium]